MIPEFGQKRDNEERRDGGCAIVFDPVTKLYAVGKQDDGSLRLFSGGVNVGEDIKDGIMREVEEESGLYDFRLVEKVAEAKCHYFNSLKKVNRVAHATCLLIVLNSKKVKPVHLEAHEKFVLHWTTQELLLENLKARNQNKDNDHWIYFMERSVDRLVQLGCV